MTLAFKVAILLLLAAPAAAVECGPSGASVKIAGSATVLPLATLWAESYIAQCAGIEIVVEGGGSSVGSGRVCADSSRGAPVDIGDMSRNWTEKEAKTVDGVDYQCSIGDTSRSIIQVDVAVDGLSVATAKGGHGQGCIDILGGLTPDQLRWIYSSYDADTLLATGWDAASLANSDGRDDTHLWSELDPACAASDIRIAGPGNLSGTFAYFLETILVDFKGGEKYDDARPNGYYNSQDDEVLVAYTEANSDAIAYFGYAYLVEHSSSLSAARIKNAEGVYVAPSPETVADGSYNPLSRRIYMNLLDTNKSLKNTRPLLEFGLSAAGAALVATTGYVPVPDAEIAGLLARLPPDSNATDAPASSANPTPVPGANSLLAKTSSARPVEFFWLVAVLGSVVIAMQ